MAQAVPKVTGQVRPDGKLYFSRAQRQRLDRWVLSLRRPEVEREVEVIVRPLVDRKTVPQMAYLHADGGPFPVLAEHFGCSLAEIKPALAGACWGWQRDPVSRRELPINPTVSEWTKEQASHFIDWVLPWAATEHQVYIEPPEAFSI